MLHFLIAHVTVLLIVAFFILFAASKAEGIISLFGNILGVWVIVIAILHVVAHFMPGTFGMKPGTMHGHWMHHWGEQQTAPAPAAAPAKPAPAPAKPAPAPKKP